MTLRGPSGNTGSFLFDYFIRDKNAFFYERNKLYIFGGNYYV